jgi:4-amino-4-deoxy-L-arabinose transferase-like glycosyltransferase
VIQEMARGEHLLDVGLLGGIENARPLLFYWVALGLVRLGGANELSLRLLPALATIAAVLALYWLARRTLPAAGLLAGVLYACLHLPVRLSRRPTEDALLVALLLFALLAYLQARDRPRAWLRWGALVGAAVLTKGVPAGLALATVTPDLLLFRRRELGTRWPWLGGLVALAVAAPFHVMQSVRHGSAFWHDYLVRNVIDRSEQPLHARTDVLFYARELIAHDPVLALVLVGGAVLGVRALLRARSPDALPVVLATVAPMLAFSLVQTRSHHYMLPAYGPLAVLAGVGLATLLQSGRQLGLVAALMATLGLAFRMRELVAPDYAPDLKALSRAAAQRLEPGATVHAFDVYHPAVAFYSGRPTALITVSPSFYRDLVAAPLLGRSPAIRLVDRAQLEALIAASPDFCGISPRDRAGILVRAAAAARSGQLPDAITARDHVLVCSSR